MVGSIIVALFFHASQLAYGQNNGDGHWTRGEIDHIRMSLKNKEGLMALEAANVTNETELLFVTPISDAPTQAPTNPTVASVTLTFANINAASFNESRFRLALGLKETQSLTTTFTVKSEALFTFSDDANLTEANCMDMVAIAWSLPVSNVKQCTVALRLQSGRRLGTQSVSIVAQTSDSTKAAAAQNAAGNTSAYTAGLTAVNPELVKNLKIGNVTASVEATAIVSQVVTSAAEQTQALTGLANVVNGADAAATDLGSATVVTKEQPTIIQDPTPAPTVSPTPVPPTATPTALPQGETFAPTGNPTAPTPAPPTMSPTPPPTTPPPTTPPPTSPPTEPPTTPPTEPPTTPSTEPPTSPPTKPPTKPPTSPPTYSPTVPTSAPTDAPTSTADEESGANIQAAGGFWLASLACAVYTL